jgi:hypothetical protein
MKPKICSIAKLERTIARVLLVATTDRMSVWPVVAFCWSGVKGDQKPDQPSRMIVTLDHLTNYLLPMIF